MSRASTRATASRSSTSSARGPQKHGVRRHHRGWRFGWCGPRGSPVAGAGPPRPPPGGRGPPPRPPRRVLLLDAGPDFATLELTPDDLQDAWRMSLREHDWGLTAEAVPGRVIPYPRGRVIGGSSAVNATIALRGVPADYDEWAALGNDGWGWAKVLPHFRRLEDDPEGADELHGRGGPIAIRRWRRDELIPTQRAFFEVCRRLGFPEVPDHNHPEAAGVGPFPQNRRGRLRLSTAIAYLLPARQRPNLTIRPECHVS